MRTKALWFLLIMTVSLTLTLACGAADEPAAESPGPPSPGVAQTTDAMTPAGSSESAGGAAGAETTGTSSPMTDNSSMPLAANPATGSQGTVPGQPAVQQPTSVPPAPAEAEPEPTAEPTPPPTMAPTPTPFRPSAEGDRAILAELYHATNGDSWADNENWLSEQPLGEWYGVDTEGDRVVGLDLAANDLSGTLPARLWLMSQLRELYLEDNELTGEIPRNYRYPRITIIDLSSNQLSGCVPALVAEAVGTNSADYGPLERCPGRDRQALEAFYNSTGGPNWTNQWNWLTDAPISQWGGVQATPDGKVTGLFLNVNNNLNGPIPPEIGKLEDLEILEIASKAGQNYYVAKSEGRDVLPSLTEVKGNRITSPLPQELFTLKKLRILSLKTTGLTGQLPAAELAKLESLETLVLEENLFEGRIPPELGIMKQLLRLNLSRNQLSGQIPPSLGNLKGLGELRLTSNQLTGEIPRELANMDNLVRLELSGNMLSGEIPRELAKLDNLFVLNLLHNMLSGELPRQLARMESLRILNVAYNQLTGDIPAAFAEHGYLSLYTDNNNFNN